ncbi:hypothetical protein MTR_8g009495 [Medicago truncatula]|uniref:Uncharacterized protein n=1 Tax=Medicago truncatula TaxID=3880 RepID=A0A072TKN0_MEDTR|nr:hypothetical protein MTR_8g009495 [Medicago truncatula]
MVLTANIVNINNNKNQNMICEQIRVSRSGNNRNIESVLQKETLTFKSSFSLDNNLIFGSSLSQHDFDDFMIGFGGSSISNNGKATIEKNNPRKPTAISHNGRF